MTVLRATLLLGLAITLAPAPSQAQNLPEGFGLGIVLGEPTGLTARFWSGANNFQSHAAWSFTGNAAFQISGDYLRSGDIDSDPVIPFYFGAGLRAKFSDEFELGIRIPLGLNYVLQSEPIEFFGEMVPVMDIVPETHFDFQGALGVRYYFRSSGNRMN
jgi:hypothetical protein